MSGITALDKKQLENMLYIYSVSGTWTVNIIVLGKKFFKYCMGELQSPPFCLGLALGFGNNNNNNSLPFVATTSIESADSVAVCKK